MLVVDGWMRRQLPHYWALFPFYFYFFTFWLVVSTHERISNHLIMLSKGSIGNKDGEASNQHGHRAGHVLGTQSGGRML